MSVFEYKDTVLVVGGLGSRNGRYHKNGGGCTKAFVDAKGGFADFDLSKIMTDYGGALLSYTDGNSIYERSTGKITLPYLTSEAENYVGLLVYVEEAGTTGFSSDRYEILQTDSANKTITIESEIGGDGAIVNLYIGGAVDTLSTALSNSTAVFNNTFIFTNLNEVISSSINVMGKGSAGRNTYLNVIGFNTTLLDMCYGGQYYQSAFEAFSNGISSAKNVVLDGNNGTFDLFSPTSQTNTGFYNFHFANVQSYSFNLGIGTCKNVLFDNCKFSNCQQGVRFNNGENCHIHSCYFHNDILQAAVYGAIGHISASVISGSVSAGNNMTLLSGGSVRGCLYINGYKHAINHSGTELLDVSDNTFYNIPEIVLRSQGGGSAEFNNNICVIPQASRVVKFISSLGGNIISLDNNCYWGSDGNALSTLFETEITDGHLPAKGRNDFELDPVFADVSSGNFSPMNKYIANGGRTINGNPTYIGAVRPKQKYKSNARAANFGRLSIIRS